MAPRKLKYHEQKLLKKLNLYEWKDERRHAKWSVAEEQKIVQKYQLRKRGTFRAYLMLSIDLRRVMDMCRSLPEDDAVREEVLTGLMTKVQRMGLLKPNQRSPVDLGRVHPARFCERRLAVVLCRLKMAPSITDGIRFVEQGHIRVGPEVITDPDFLVPVSMEDYVTWVDSSKIRSKLLAFSGERDDFI